MSRISLERHRSISKFTRLRRIVAIGDTSIKKDRRTGVSGFAGCFSLEVLFDVGTRTNPAIPPPPFPSGGRTYSRTNDRRYAVRGTRYACKARTDR